MKKQTHKRCTIYLDERLVNYLDDHAEMEARSRSEMINRHIMENVFGNPKYKNTSVIKRHFTFNKHAPGYKTP